MAAALLLGACAYRSITRIFFRYECKFVKIIRINFKGQRLATGLPVALGTPQPENPFTRDYFNRIRQQHCFGRGVELWEPAHSLAVQEGDVNRGCFLAGSDSAMVKKESLRRKLSQKSWMNGTVLQSADKWVK
jgi:hypothetical protein